ncbi:MAG: SCO family protein [Candidatus Devosia symbiotica]|nr:SCO family protein [Candidatus Devosia symbiotica]
MNANTLRNFRIILWALVAVMAIGATALYAFKPPARPLGLTGQAFALNSTKGGAFTQDDLVGTPSLIFFGFTFCPDVCPTTLAEITAIREKLGLTPEQLRIIFVSVDPERDTLAMVRDYVESFNPSIIGLVGSSPEQTENAKATFGVFSEKVGDPSDPYYTLNHTALTFLVKADGTFQGTITYQEGQDTAIAKVKRLVQE